MNTTDLKDFDADIYAAINDELVRQQNNVELIASENIVSKAVLEAQGSILTNKYAEGYPQHRYYGGCAFVDKIEQLAIDRLKQLFNAQFANVQPHSGSQANMAVFKYIEGWYNRKRLHSSINYMTPDQCELLARSAA